MCLWCMSFENTDLFTFPAIESFCPILLIFKSDLKIQVTFSEMWRKLHCWGRERWGVKEKLFLDSRKKEYLKIELVLSISLPLICVRIPHNQLILECGRYIESIFWTRFFLERIHDKITKSTPYCLEWLPWQNKNK